MVINSGMQCRVFQHFDPEALGLLHVPYQTLKTSKLLIWGAASTAFVLTANSVKEILIPQADQIIYSRRQQFLHWREQMIPAYQLSELLSYTNPLLELHSDQHGVVDSEPDAQSEPMLVISQGQQMLALESEVEYLVTEPELVIKPFEFENPLQSYVYGYTIWKDRLIQVIDVASLLSQTIGKSQTPSAAAKLSDSFGAAVIGKAATPAMTTVKKPSVLVVDNSKAVRQIVCLTLQQAGYQVLQAQDGQEAIAKLQQNLSIQLAISGIEMPNLNGFMFLRHRLKNPLLAKVPVVILSSCSSNRDRQLAMQLGATTYFTKPYIEQEFLAAIKVIIEQT